MKNYDLMIILLVLLCLNLKAGDLSISLKMDDTFKDLAISVADNDSRPFVYTNKSAAFFYGETGGIRQDGHMGFNVLEKKYLDDYILKIGELELKRENALETTVYPDRVQRKYADEITEDLFLLDKINCLVIKLTAKKKHSFSFEPLLPASFDLNNYQLEWNKSDNLLMLLPNSQNDVAAEKSFGIKFNCSADFNRQSFPLVGQSTIPDTRPGLISFKTKSCTIFIVVADDKDDLLHLCSDVEKNINKYVSDKKSHIVRLLEKCAFQSDQPLLNKAFQWALISMDQLIMKQPGGGKEVTAIFAGLPWFNNYWGRDTFISFPGAVLATGKFAEAREILLSFVTFQNADSSSEFFGRIPNRVTVNDIIFNTTDGTPWFVRELWEYYLYSGDFNLIEELFPTVKRSIEGALKFHTDHNYFLTHGDAETWMDAQGGEGAWSPRGNRAVEIQALWFEQLLAAANMADLLNQTGDAQNWRQIAEQLKQNFQHYFWNISQNALVDHLNSDDSPDEKIRPNQIFALSVVEETLLRPEQELLVLEQVTTKLTYPYGVASLWQHDPDFHPYHQFSSQYPKDEAYHNGTVWCWLAGPVISSLLKYDYADLADDLLESESDQILNWGAAGTYSELLDALPKSGQTKPAISGTVSQAWSLAEYLRNIYQDLLGIRPNLPERKIKLFPHLPEKISQIRYSIPLPMVDIVVEMKRQVDQSFEVEIDYISGKDSLEIELTYPVADASTIAAKFEILPGSQQSIKIIPTSDPRIYLNEKLVAFQLTKLPIAKQSFPKLTFVQPELDKNLKCLAPPPYPLFSGDQITAQNPQAEIIFDVADPTADDKGCNGKLTYPTSAFFKEGIFDITHFLMSQDKDNYYFCLKFRELVQPGWHPEYGFQLTFAAFVFDLGGGRSGNQRVGRNANYALPDDMAYNRIIYIGGGIQLENDHGEILAAYRPSDARFPIGDVSAKQIRFAISKTYLGQYQKNWRLMVLAGGQDDHGGAGLGEFRGVGKEATDWSGGGGEGETGNCNVYDFLLVK